MSVWELDPQGQVDNMLCDGLFYSLMTTSKLSRRAQRVKTIIGWSSFVLFIVTQWEVHPWPLFSLSFFGLLWIWYLLSLYEKPRLCKAMVLVGGTLNGLALFANGGRMPVLGRAEVSRWWQPLTNDSHLVFLCDIYMKFSIGDMIVLAEVVIVPLVTWLIQRNQVISSAAQVDLRRTT